MEDNNISFASNSLASKNYTENNTDDSDKYSLASDLILWVNKYTPSREAINELFKILGSYGLDLPRDYHTLLKIP